MEKLKPIKRSPELTPLSHEHHSSLLFVWKIRQGLKNDISLDRLRKYTLWYWKEHTKPHFFIEEKVLLPYMPAGHPWIAQMINEHALIRESVLTIDKEPDKDLFKCLADMAERHIRWEERKFFGFLEENLSKEQLTNIQSELEKQENACDDWEDEFWIKK